MITIEDVFSKENQSRAWASMATKEGGTIGITDEVKTFWQLNRDRIIADIAECQYQPDTVNEYEIVSGNGKRRMVNQLSSQDKLITRLLSQCLSDCLEPGFSPNSHAYQSGKGTQTATWQARDYIEAGGTTVVEIDIEHFFDELSLERLVELLENVVQDSCVMALIRSCLYCSVNREGVVRKVTKGVLQGSPLSPVLSNLYLDAFDTYMTEKGYHWVRFADDIRIYVGSKQQGVEVLEDAVQKLKTDFSLNINSKKSGVFDACERWFLGYEFVRQGKRVLVRRHEYQKHSYNRSWQPCSVERINQEYHLVQNGILNKKDYALLFENEDEKHHIPVEATEQLDLYNEVILSGAVMRTLAYENIRLALYDKYGTLLGYFVPEGYVQDNKTLMAQCLEYVDNGKRLAMAKSMEIAAIHNLRANIRYYAKQHSELKEVELELSEEIKKMNAARQVDELLLIEARCRQKYYRAFNTIIDDLTFYFEKRSKRPPTDEINALISFGNTLLYNRIQQMIWHTSLDSRIGIFHSATRRHYSLNLDFADLFKPLIVDRVIFSLVNRGQLTRGDFRHLDEGAVYLSDRGKKLFIKAFEEKMHSRLVIKNIRMTYSQLLESEIRLYLNHIRTGETYKPYKYY